ncbi:nitrate- and nitrite sensing domain-containing protein [Streptosporangium sp. NPDC004631]
MRSRLIALIVVPTAAAVLLGGLQVLTSMRAATEYQQVNELARLSDHIGALTHELAQERDRTAWYIARGRPENEAQAIRQQMNAVDTAAAHVRESGALLRQTVTGRTWDGIETVLTRLEELGPLRQQVLGPSLLSDAAIDAYSRVIDDLLSLHDELGKGSDDDVLFSQALTLRALARAKDALSTQRALLSAVLVAGRFGQEQMERFLGAISAERNERRTFIAEAGSAERRLFDETVNGRTADRAEFLRELVLLRADSGTSLKGLDRSKKDDAKEWYSAVTVTIDRMREVERRHTQAIVTRSEELGRAEQTHALLVAAAVVGLLLIVLLITTGVARSLVKPLRRLRREALQVAGERLPAYVQQVRESRDGEIVADVAPIGVLSRDEIGEVARAFDEVHREAVRLAGDEARLRTTVNAMFVNLSRRSQTLVERQLSLVERLERGERDDQRLADLFKLDHLATRMRRNSESLLVLAGQEVTRRRRRPVELMDVVRASLSEVENYERVVTRMQSEVAVVGPAVSDVVHLLAELVENALSFSPSESKVAVASSPVEGEGVMVLVTDQGIGIPPDELSRVNWRLANPQAADASVARRMGLFVVGRLALKHGIRVRLRPQETGLTAMVLLPDAILVSAASQTGAPQLSGATQPGRLSPATGGRPPATGELGSTAGPALPGDSGAPAPSESTAPTLPALSVSATRRTRAVPSQTRPERPVRKSERGTLPKRQNTPSRQDDRPSRSPRREEGPAHRPSPGPLGRPSVPGPPTPDVAESLPGVGTSALDPGEEFLPIFASVESGWFRIADSAGDAGRPGEPKRPGDSTSVTSEPAPWSSPGDSGWQAAQAVSAPVLGGTTVAGLPKRTPRANLVPGSAASDSPQPEHPPVRMTPEHARSRLASFQQGVRRARNEIPKRES